MTSAEIVAVVEPIVLKHFRGQEAAFRSSGREIASRLLAGESDDGPRASFGFAPPDAKTVLEFVMLIKAIIETAHTLMDSPIRRAAKLAATSLELQRTLAERLEAHGLSPQQATLIATESALDVAKLVE